MEREKGLKLTGMSVTHNLSMKKEENAKSQQDWE